MSALDYFYGNLLSVATPAPITERAPLEPQAETYDQLVARLATSFLRKLSAVIFRRERRMTLSNAASYPTRLRVVGYTNDRRNRWLAVAGRHLDDRAIEAKWRARVAAHPVERRRLGLDRPYVRESISTFLKRQAN